MTFPEAPHRLEAPLSLHTRLDPELCYRAIESRDHRFDGSFIVAVTSTGIYCRPSCPTPVRPKAKNCRYFVTAAAAQLAGFRACKRCRPDASPGSPRWNLRADLVGRAMRLISDGAVDRGGVADLARQLNTSERHINRVLTAELGAGPLALARAQRAQTARVLIETTDLRFADVAFAAGFSSIRQFNDTVLEVFATTPTSLRAASSTAASTAARANAGTIALRLPFRVPFAADSLFRFLALRAVPGVEHGSDTSYARVLTLPGGEGTVQLEPQHDHIVARLQLDTMSDLATAVSRCRRLLDLDCDPIAIDDVLRRDQQLAALVRRCPGLRSPGAVDGAELAVRALLGQQISVVAARTAAARLAQRYGTRLGDRHSAGLSGGQPPLTHHFPTAAQLAGVRPSELPMPAARARTLITLCEQLADRSLVLDTGADRVEAQEQLKAITGIGPWTASYISMRALSDPDAFLPTDLGLRKGAQNVALPATTRLLEERAEQWRPWRSYATHHLWNAH